MMVLRPPTPESPRVLMPESQPQNSDIIGLGYSLGVGSFLNSLHDLDVHSRLRTTTLDSPKKNVWPWALEFKDAGDS